MGTVLKFPNNKKAKKVNTLRQRESKRAFLTLSILSLILGTVWMNNLLTQESHTYTVVGADGASSNRGIASANADSDYKDIVWEQSLANKLKEARDQRGIASVTRGLSSADDIKYSEIQGHYTILYTSGNEVPKVKEIFFNPGEQNLDPVMIKPEEFLVKYKDAFQISFDDVEPAKMSTNPESTGKAKRDTASLTTQSVYTLTQDNKPVGKAVFEFDSDGHFLTLKFQ